MARPSVPVAPTNRIRNGLLMRAHLREESYVCRDACGMRRVMGVSPASLSRDGARAKRNETDPTRIEEILRQVRLKSGLTLAGGLGPLLHGGLHAAVHIFGSDVFDMLRQTPDVTERIAHFAIAISPELVLQRHFDGTAGLHSAIEKSINVFGIDE